MATIKKFLDKSSWITGQLTASATREDAEPWRGLVIFVASSSIEACEVHYTPEGYPTTNEALAAAVALSARLFPPGAPRELDGPSLRVLGELGDRDAGRLLQPQPQRLNLGCDAALGDSLRGV